MRERKWVLYLFVSIVVIVSLYIYGLQYFDANDRIKNYILAQLRPILGENCDISQVHVGLGTVRFVDVKIPLPDEQFSVTIDNIRIGFNLFKLLYQGINPQTVSQDILIDHPELYINAIQQDSVESTQPLLTYPDFGKIKETYKKQFQRLEILNRLTIIDGVIYYQVNDSLQVLLAHSIEGGFFLNKTDSLDLRLTGKLFTSEQENLNILARTHSKRGTISFIKAELGNYKLDDYLTETLLPDFKFTSGEINGEMNLVRKTDADKGFDLSGQIRVRDAAAQWQDKTVEITDLNIDAHINDWNMIIDHATQQLNGAPMSITGNVYNVIFPVFDLNVESTGADITSLQPFIHEKIMDRLAGKFRYKANVKGSFTNFEIHNELWSNRVTFDNLALENVYLHNRYYDKKLYFETARLSLFDNHFNISGDLDFSTPDATINGYVEMQGDLKERLLGLGVARLDSAQSRLQAVFSGPMSNPVLNGNGQVGLYSQNDNTLLDLELLLKNKILSVQTRTHNGNPHINGTLDFRQLPVSTSMQFSDVQKWILPYWNLPFPEYLDRNIAMESEIEGNIREFTVKTSLNHLDGGYFVSRFAHMELNVANNKQMRGVGRLTIYPDAAKPLEGKFRFIKNQNSLQLQQFNLSDQLFLNMSLLQKPDGAELQGELRSESMDIARLFNRSDSLFTGNLNMIVNIHGTAVNPAVDARLSIDNLVYQELGPYQSRLNVALDSSEIKLSQFTLNSDDVTLLYAQGGYNKLADSLDFFVKGAGFNLDDVLQSGEDSPAISGNSLVDVNVSGSKTNPLISGKIAVKAGDVYDVPFDEMEIDLDPANTLYPGLQIKDFRLTRHGFYELQGKGVYPFSKNDSLDINISGTGNFLQILSDKVSFFKGPKSDCLLEARISGSPDNPRLVSARVDLENGEMYCGSVIPPMEQLSANFEFVPDGQFIHIRNLSGLMGGKPFKIHNELAPVRSARPLENIIIGDTGLNLGILIPETPENGIPLNIDGLMEPDVYGNLDLKGRDGEDDFYFAWINDNPIFRGTIELNDCEFMYPFYEGASNPSQVVKEFLYRMEWNIVAKPERDVRYVKTFPGAIDNVYVNLQLNEKYSRLEFSGQLRDDSFRINGEVRSTKGIIEYLGMDFRIDRAGAEFDRSTLEPVVYGSARTTIADSAGIPSQVYLTMQTHDITMDKKQVDDIARLETTRGRWNDIRFKLSSDNPNFGSTEGQLLTNLGYANASLQQNPAIDAIGFGTENMLLRPLIRPVEKQLEKTLGLDYVRFSSMFTKNLLEFNLNNNLQVNNRLSLLKSTRLVVGKYIADKVFLQYTGQVESGIDYRYKDINVGLHHRMGLEYQINPRLLLELEYDYDSMIWQRENRDDKRIVLRHWFPF